MNTRPVALFWVQHLLGSGHLRRALTVSGALAEVGFSVVLATGGPPMPWPAPAGVEIVQLPILRAADDQFSGLVDEHGAPPSPPLWAERVRLLRELLHRKLPAVVLTEMYPFGRRAFRHEVAALLSEAQTLPKPPLVVSTIRDVLVSKTKPERWREMRDIALARYDLVLAHGDVALFPFGRSFPFADELGDRLVHTGFVLTSSEPAPREAMAAVLVSVGGGAVGSGLLAVALAARPLTQLAGASWRLIGGHNLPAQERDRLQAGLGEGVILDGHRADLPGLMAGAEVAVCQAGYNTVVEGLAARARMVLVPFDGEGQDEQRARASRLSELDMAQWVESSGLSPSALAAAIDRARTMPRPVTSGLSFDGARHTAELIRRRVVHDAAG